MVLVQSDRAEGTPPDFNIAESEDGGNDLRPMQVKQVNVCSMVHLCPIVSCYSVNFQLVNS